MVTPIMTEKQHLWLDVLSFIWTQRKKKLVNYWQMTAFFGLINFMLTNNYSCLVGLVVEYLLELSGVALALPGLCPLSSGLACFFPLIQVNIAWVQKLVPAERLVQGDKSILPIYVYFL